MVPSLTHQVQPRDEVHIFLMVATLSVCAYITAIKEAADGGAFIGSHLLGAFVAGMCFVNVPRSQQIWNSQMKRVVKWMVRFFFAASVGFAVPVSEMFTWDAFGNGLLLAIGPTIATKVTLTLILNATITLTLAPTPTLTLIPTLTLTLTLALTPPWARTRRDRGGSSSASHLRPSSTRCTSPWR